MSDFSDLEIENFLKRIAQVESAGGKNTKHKLIKKGLQKGQTAIGSYGLLPNTIEEFYKRNELQPEENKDPLIASLKGLKQNQYREVLMKNPEIEKAIAKNMARYVLDRQQGDVDRAAFSWNAGHNYTPKQLSDERIANSDYVRKFRKADERFAKEEEMGPFRQDNLPVQKAPARSSIEPKNRQDVPDQQPFKLGPLLAQLQGDTMNDAGSMVLPDDSSEDGRLRIIGPQYQKDTPGPLSEFGKRILESNKQSMIDQASDLDVPQKLYQYLQKFGEKPRELSKEETEQKEKELRRYKYTTPEGFIDHSESFWPTVRPSGVPGKEDNLPVPPPDTPPSPNTPLSDLLTDEKRKYSRLGKYLK